MVNATNVAILENYSFNNSQDACSPLRGDIYYLQMATEYVIAVLVLVFNSVTIAVLVKSRILRRETSIFLISLCVADICISPSILVCSFYDYFAYKMSIGYAMSACYTCMLLQSIAITGSYFALLFCAIERFISVLYPLRYDTILTPKVVKTMVSIKWIYNLVLNIIPVTFVQWRPNIPCFQYLDVPNLVFESTVGIHSILSLVVTLILYSKIFWEAWKQKRRIESLESQNKNSNSSNQKLTRMMAMIIGIYLLCYLPYLIIMHYILWTNKQLPQWTCILGRAMYILVLTNSFMNPLIYFWKSSSFRNALKGLLGMKTNSQSGDA